VHNPYGIHDVLELGTAGAGVEYLKARRYVVDDAYGFAVGVPR